MSATRPTLVKTTRVLSYDYTLLGGNPGTSALVYSAVLDEEVETPTNCVSVTLPSGIVDDLGVPEQITVTIEPGDRLNSAPEVSRA